MYAYRVRRCAISATIARWSMMIVLLEDELRQKQASRRTLAEFCARWWLEYAMVEGRRSTLSVSVRVTSWIRAAAGSNSRYQARFRESLHPNPRTDRLR
jgi:hypothetical protein